MSSSSQDEAEAQEYETRYAISVSPALLSNSDLYFRDPDVKMEHAVRNRFQANLPLKQYLTGPGRHGRLPAMEEQRISNSRHAPYARQSSGVGERTSDDHVPDTRRLKFNSEGPHSFSEKHAERLCTSTASQLYIPSNQFNGRVTSKDITLHYLKIEEDFEHAPPKMAQTFPSLPTEVNPYPLPQARLLVNDIQEGNDRSLIALTLLDEPEDDSESTDAQGNSEEENHEQETVLVVRAPESESDTDNVYEMPEPPRLRRPRPRPRNDHVIFNITDLPNGREILKYWNP